MTNKTRKRLWPVSLVMAVAVVGALAAFLMLASSPTNTAAHDGASGSTHCDDLSTLGRIAHDNDPNNDHDCATGPTSPPPTDPDGNGDMMAEAMIGSSSTSASSTVELTLMFPNLTAADVEKIGVDGGSVEVFLEDDFQVPDDISAGSVYFRLTGRWYLWLTTSTTETVTGGEGRVRATYDVEVNDGDFFGGDDDWAIQVFLPDFYTASVDKCGRLPGPHGWADPGHGLHQVRRTSRTPASRRTAP